MYLYCLSNPAMDGILRIHFSELPPSAHLLEVNAKETRILVKNVFGDFLKGWTSQTSLFKTISDSWRPNAEYKLEFAKCMPDMKAGAEAPYGAEKALYKVLERYSDRINPRRDFFRISVEEVRDLFELMEGLFTRQE